MVLFFTTCDESYIVYCGLDKFENETLIKYSFPIDVWFHADKHSSAHYYLRLKEGETINDIPENVLEDIAQMTKESSKDGRKKDNIRIIYTLASNLKKTGDMETGEVGFHNRNTIKYIMVHTKKSDILKRLIKTREERDIDMKKELENYLNEEKRKIKMNEINKKKEEMKKLEERKKLKELKNYSTLMSSDKMKSNTFINDDIYGNNDDDDNDDDNLDSTFDDFM
eukprot:gene11152-3974_t